MKKLCIWFKVVVFSCVFLFLFTLVNNVLRNKDNAQAITTFYAEPKDTIDVVFMGSSHMLNAIYPMDLWNQFGITSYNFAQHGQSFPMTYYAMEEVFSKQSPKVIVVDTFLMLDKSKTNNYPYLHKTIDNMKWGRAKISAINDLLKSGQQGKDDRLEFALNMVLYHTRWKELSKNDFSKIKDYNKGAEIRVGRYECPQLTIVDKKEQEDIEKSNLRYLEKMINLCKKNNAELLLVNMPYDFTNSNYEVFGSGESQQRKLNYIYKIAKENGINYKNYFYEYEKIGFDFSNDLFDYGHVNPFGAIKLTNDIGNYLVKEYDIYNHKGDLNYSSWDEDYALYKRSKEIKILKSITDMEYYIQYLRDLDYVVLMSVKDNAGVSVPKEILGELEDLGLVKYMDIKSADSYLSILKDGEVVYEELSDKAINYFTNLGNHELQLCSQGWLVGNSGSIKIDNFEYRIDKRGLGIVVYDEKNNEVIDSVTFDIMDGLKCYR